MNCRSQNWIARIAVVVVLAALTGCSSVRVTNTWRDPSFTGPIHFNKIAVIVLHPDGPVRRAAEDEMVKVIGPDRAIAGYTFLTDDDRKTAAKVKAKVEAAGFDGAVTMKLAGSRNETTYIPGSAGYAPFYDYYDRSGAFAGDQGVVVSDTIVSIQTNIFSVKDGKLIWACTTELANPSDARKVVASIAKAVEDELRKEKLL
jgi:hypothetical protein